MDRNNKLFIAASLANGASFSMILPLLAPLIRELKLSELQGGAMVSICALLMAPELRTGQLSHWRAGSPRLRHR